MKNVPHFLSLSLFATTALFAHEVSTHERIGDAAVIYVNASFPQRPLLLGSVDALQKKLWIGEVAEDRKFPPALDWPLGRFLFHFTPALDFIVQGSNQVYYDAISATGCSSVDWGQSVGPSNGATGCYVSCALPPLSLFSLLTAPCAKVAGVPQYNTFRWDQDLGADNTGAPSATSIEGFGYVVHLLEDLGSPPHTRNDAHPCVPVFQLYCDQFEQFNNNKKYAPFGDPVMLNGGIVWTTFLAATIVSGTVTQVIPTAGFTSPADYFNALQQYVSSNYYSNRTACNGAGPQCQLQFSDGNYFYGSCLVSSSGIYVSEIAETCNSMTFNHQQYMVRKIAHKGSGWWAGCQPAYSGVGCDNTKADIDQTIAREQFAELGPVIAQHVAAFIQFYAPALNVQIQGSGTVTSKPGALSCTSGTCSALFPQGTSVTLTASAPVTWGGDCASAGSASSATVVLSKDATCQATFSTPNVTFAATGAPAYYYAGTYPPTSFPYSYTSTSTTSWSAGIPNYIESSGTFGGTSASAHYQGFASCVGNGFNSDVYNGELLTVSTKGPAGAIYYATVTLSVTLTNNILTAGSGSSEAVTQNEMYPIRIDGGGTIYNTVQSLPFSATNTQVVSMLAFDSYQVSSVSTAGCAYIVPPFSYSFTASDAFDITVRVDVTN
jgi:hypothetical protein